MDIVFKCPHCQTELEVEADAAGETIPCPACNKEIRIPASSGGTPPPPPPPRAATPAAKEEKKFAVPVSNKPVEPLIQKALPSLEAQSRIDGKKLIRLKTDRKSVV